MQTDQKAVPFVPANDNVLIRRDPPSEKSKGGILLPETAKKGTRKGVIVAIGPGRMSDTGNRLPVSFRVGQEVVFHDIGFAVGELGEEYILIPESGILGSLPK